MYSLSMFSSQDLLLVLAIAESGSVTAAAESLYTSQPALSRSLGILESRVGAPLFERHARGMVATPIGEVLAAHGRAIRAVTERARRQAGIAIALDAARLHLGVVPHLSLEPLSRAALAIRETHPNLRVVIRVGEQATLLDDLRHGHSDLLIGLLHGADADFKTTPLFEETPVLVARTQHPLLRDHADCSDLATLHDYRWLLPPPNDPVHERLKKLFLDHALDVPGPAIVCADLPLAMSIALKADYIVVVPRDVAQFALASGQFGILPVTLPGQNNVVGAIQRRDLADSAEALSLIECLQVELGRVGIERSRPMLVRAG